MARVAPRLLRHFLILFVGLLALPLAPARAADYEALSALERDAVDQGLAEHGLVLDQDPEGKRVGRVFVTSLEVFAEDNPVLSWANLFHWTTRDHVIEREVLLKRGEPWDPELVAETERNLRDPFLRSVVAVVPVHAPEPQTVDVLVVTRDIWSLRGNTNFQTTGSVLNFLSTSLSENNFLGLNKKVAATFRLDQDTYDVGALYSDPRLAGTRLSLYVDQAILLNQDTGAVEGTSGVLGFGLPLYSTRQRWGFDVSLSDTIETYRDFEGQAVRTWDDPETEEVEALPRVYEWVGVRLEAIATRSLGTEHKVNLSFGYGLSYRDADLPGGFDAGGAVRERYVADVLPRSETASYGILGLTYYKNDWVTLYDVETLALSEEYRVGPRVSVSMRWASRALFFSERDFATFSAEAGWIFDLGASSLLWLDLSAGTRLEGRFIDSTGSIDMGGFTPVLLGFARLHARALLSARWDDTTNGFWTLGGDTGLRGLPSRALAGENLLRTNLELRTLSLGWWIFRGGLVAFYDAGTTFDDWEAIVPIHSVGLGARILIVPVNRNVLRLDYAVPLNGVAVGFEHGVFTAGFDQAF